MHQEWFPQLCSHKTIFFLYGALKRAEFVYKLFRPIRSCLRRSTSTWAYGMSPPTHGRLPPMSTSPSGDRRGPSSFPVESKLLERWLQTKTQQTCPPLALLLFPLLLVLLLLLFRETEGNGTIPTSKQCKAWPKVHRSRFSTRDDAWNDFEKMDSSGVTASILNLLMPVPAPAELGSR